MDINTQSGQQTIDPESLITIPRGMLGFEALTRFKLFHEADKPTVFWLQSVDDTDIQFSVADPMMFNVAYEITLSDQEADQIKLAGIDDLAVLVTLARDTDEAGGIHANFMAPILINTRERLGMQKALNQVESQVLIRAS